VGPLLLILLVALALFVLGFLVKLLWIAAAIVLVVWLVFFASRRRR
jgi:hypothetical protein